MKKIIVSLVLLLIVSFTFSPLFSQTQTHYEISDSAKMTTAKLKSCVSDAGNGFPFWRRVCSDCRVHFISGNGGRSTCWKS